MEDREKEVPPEVAAPGIGSDPSPGTGGAEPDETADLKSRLAYLAAEFDNFRKRAARGREAQAA